MNKSDLVDVAAEGAGVSKASTECVVNAFLAAIADGLSRGERVTISGFGTFEVRKKEAKNARVPKTGKVVSVPKHLRPAFVAGEGLKRAVR